jgi:Spy/CpxP family protein refolding chaperone
MKDSLNKQFRTIGLSVVGLTLFIAPVALGQSGVVPQQPETAAQQPAAGTQQPEPPQDPIAQLNLTPEQRQQIRAIREQSKDERAIINRRLRETRQALNQALDADPPNETLIEQRAREAGDAEAASIRLRAITQTRIRRVLTVEQVRTLRQLQAEAQQNRREQRIENRAEKRQANPNQRNGIVPGAKRVNPLRRMKP